MFIGEIIGFLGSDAKETQKGHSFNVSTKYRENNEEKTLWICCFLNYPNKVVEHLKSGRMVYVLGDITVSTYQRETGEVVPSVTMNVRIVNLLPNK